MATPVIRVRFSTDHMARLYNKASQSKNCKAAPNVSKVQITDMLLLTTSFLGYPLPRSHRHGGFEKKNVSIHKLFLSFVNKGGCSYVYVYKNGASYFFLFFFIV